MLEEKKHGCLKSKRINFKSVFRDIIHGLTEKGCFGLEGEKCKITVVLAQNALS